MAAPHKNNAFLASDSSLMRNAMQTRRLASDVPHLIPILDSLPASAVVCEVGCGPGGMTLDIAQHYPNLIVLGMDIDEQSIKQASEAAAATSVTNLRYALGDAVNLYALANTPGFEAIDGGCDLVYTSASVMHTPNQRETVKQLCQASKLGGTVSILEGDMGLNFVYPENEGMTKFLEVLQRLAAARGADPYTGRKLMSYAMAAGYSRNDITEMVMKGAFVSRPQERQLLAHGFKDILRNALVDPKLKQAGLKEDEVAFIENGFDEWSKYEDGLLVWPAIIVNCVKAVKT